MCMAGDAANKGTHSGALKGEVSMVGSGRRQSIHELCIALKQDLVGLKQATRPIQELAALRPPV